MYNAVIYKPGTGGGLPGAAGNLDNTALHLYEGEPGPLGSNDRAEASWEKVPGDDTRELARASPSPVVTQLASGE